MAQILTVDLGPRSYDVTVGAGLLSGVGATAVALRDVTQVAVISDSTVAGLYGEAVMRSLRDASLESALIGFPPGEASKTLAMAGTLYDELFAITPAIDRNCLIIALGGGVPGDLGGFVAATALRGLRWMQVPTTLLADVDAAVGGKTAVDHPTGKNLIGAFHQPSTVTIDVRTLKTLPREELQSGLSECVKHAVIRDATLMDFIEENAPALLSCDEEAMSELVSRNVAIKASVVAADERESGQRAHLNFGHTIGHGIEAFVGYGAITHGQCVALGMIAACTIAEKRRLLDESLRRRLIDVLKQLGLGVRRDGLDPQEIWTIMQHDKKARGGKVRFVLPTELGKVEIFDDVPEGDVIEAIGSLA